MVPETGLKEEQGGREKQERMFKLLLFLSTVYLVLVISTNGFIALFPFLREEFALSRAEVGYYSTLYYLTAALLAVYTGNVVDRLGTRPGLLFGVSFVGVTMFLFGLSPSYYLILGLSIFTGLGWSIITPAVNKIVMQRVSPQKRAMAMGIMQSGIGVGGFMGASFLPILGQTIGWRGAVQSAASITLVMGFLIYLFYREKTCNFSTGESTPSAAPERTMSLREALRYFLSSRPFLWMCAIGVLFGASVNSVLLHFTIFLAEDIGLLRTVTGVGLGVFQVGGIFGRLALGWWSDRVFRGDRRKTLYLNGLLIGLTFLLFGFFINGPHFPLTVVFFMAFLLGFFAWGWLGVFFVSTGEIAGRDLTGVATGLALVFVRTGQLLAPPFFGYIADRHGNYSMSWITFGLGIILVSFLYYLLSNPERRRKVP